MPLTVANWNAMNGLDSRASLRRSLAVITTLNAQLTVLPEAFAEDRSTDLRLALDLIHALGYRALTVPYEDADNRQDRHGMAVLVKDAAADITVERFGDRNAIVGTIDDAASEQAVTFVALHLDDRSEQSRLKQTDAVISWLQQFDGPKLAVGDFNGLHRADPKARILRTLKPLPYLFPDGQPIFGQKTPRLGRIGSLGRRVTDMATGDVLSELSRIGFADADPTRTPTFSFGNRPLLQLDHILTSNCNVESFARFLKPAGFDHFPIRATIVPETNR